MRRCVFVAMLAGCGPLADARGPDAGFGPSGTSSEMVGACAVCDMRVDSLGSLLDPYVSWRSASIVARDAGGQEQVLIAPAGERFSFTMVDNGFHSPRLYGERGEGPGEFNGIRAVTGYRGDSLAILEAVEVSIVGTSSLRGRKVRLPSRVQAFSMGVVSDSLLLFNSYAPASPLVAVVGPDGSTIAKVDTLLSGTTSLSRDPDERSVFVLPAPGERFVVLPARFRFGVEMWSIAGVPIGTVPVNPEWFVPWDAKAQADERASPQGRALTFLLDARVDDQNRLWLLGRIGDQNHPADLPAPTLPDGSTDWDRWLDTVIEVYDLGSGGRLGHLRTDLHYSGFVGEAGLYRRWNTADGLPSVSFYQLSYAIVE